jgi:membrane-bound serine protease (ClpP class)
MDPLQDFFFNPNIIYLMLVVGFSLSLMAIFTPGTGFFELGALFLFVLAGYGILSGDVPVNLWALILLVLGVIPFLLALRKSRRLVFLGVSIAALVLGSAYLFQGKGWLPLVNPFMALIVSIVTASYFWVAVSKTMEADSRPPRHDLTSLIGAIGEAKTDIAQVGSAQIAGELWSVSSSKPIAKGALVRVVSREGFTLIVEELNQ